MIMHSIIPNEIIFQQPDGPSGYDYREIEYMGEKVQVTPLSNNRYVIQRIISTSPKAFLNPALQPGTVIEGMIQ